MTLIFVPYDHSLVFLFFSLFFVYPLSSIYFWPTWPFKVHICFHSTYQGSLEDVPDPSSILLISLHEYCFLRFILWSSSSILRYSFRPPPITHPHQQHQASKACSPWCQKVLVTSLMPEWGGGGTRRHEGERGGTKGRGRDREATKHPHLTSPVPLCADETKLV